jgi:hypothetical protein
MVGGNDHALMSGSQKITEIVAAQQTAQDVVIIAAVWWKPKCAASIYWVNMSRRESSIAK